VSGPRCRRRICSATSRAPQGRTTECSLVAC
jgi:hypothetical protein